jgi:nucleoside-diphosphate-sugar epimerase
MSSFRILIMGASGFVGRHLVTATQELGRHEIVICNHSRAKADGRLSANKSIPLDVTDAAQVHAAIQSHRLTHVKLSKRMLGDRAYDSA